MMCEDCGYRDSDTAAEPCQKCISRQAKVNAHMAHCWPELPPHTQDDCQNWHKIEWQATSD